MSKHEYRQAECCNCGRHRVLPEGVCEKCLWDVEAGGYASITRPEQWSVTGRKHHIPENDVFRSNDEHEGGALR